MAAPKENKNAEKWTLEQSEELLKSALELSYSKEYDFIGEIARELNTYHDLFGYLVEKFPELSEYLKRIKANCEANCFSNGKKGNIDKAMSIVNLKSNHGWTDRIDQTSKDEKIEGNIINLGNGNKPEDE